MVEADRSVANLLMDIFGGNPYYAEGQRNQAGAYYVPVYQPLTAELIEQHLNGERVIGSYCVQEDNTVKWLAWDIDAEGDLESAKFMTKRICSRLGDLDFVVEFSGGKGYHVFLFFTTPIPAGDAKRLGEWVRDAEQLSKSTLKKAPHVEVFPKQERVLQRDAKNIGNQIKLPLGKHPYTHNWSRFVDPEIGWEDGPEMEPQAALRARVDPKAAMAVVQGTDEDKWERIVDAMVSEWKDGKRHSLSLYLSGYLATQRWTRQQAEKLIEDICRKAGDTEEWVNRRQSVHDTYSKFDKGEGVAGFKALEGLCRGGTLKTLFDLVPYFASSDMALRIERIRLEKGSPPWKKADKAVNVIWAELNDLEQGQVLKAQKPDGLSFEAYWYNAVSHEVLDMESRPWETFLYERYRLNSSDTWVRMVMAGLLLKAESSGRSVEVHRRSAYVDDILYLNMGGPEVYILDGDNTPREMFNGQGGIFFRTNPYGATAKPDWGAEKVDIWDVLINPLNFTTSRDSPIPPEQQKELLKAWMLATFFRELLPTRPLLTILGNPGSGKTTGIRRIIKVLEGMDENVLEVVEDKPDFWRTAIENHRVVVLDNLEGTKVRWLPAALDRISTGSFIEIRELYKTNRPYVIKSDVFVVLTAVNIPFSKGTTFERMLIVELQKLDRFIPENLLVNQIRNNIGALWADLMGKLNQVVRWLKHHKVVEQNMEIRIADFAYFCERLRGCPVWNGDLAYQGLKKMNAAQQHALTESEESLYPVISEWLAENLEGILDEEYTSNALFQILSAYAKEKQLEFPSRNAQGFGKSLEGMKSILDNEFGMEVIEKYNSKRRRYQLYFTFGKERGNGHSKTEADAEDAPPTTGKPTGSHEKDPFVLPLRRISRRTF